MSISHRLELLELLVERVGLEQVPGEALVKDGVEDRAEGKAGDAPWTRGHPGIRRDDEQVLDLLVLPEGPGDRGVVDDAAVHVRRSVEPDGPEDEGDGRRCDGMLRDRVDALLGREVGTLEMTDGLVRRVVAAVDEGLLAVEGRDRDSELDRVLLVVLGEFPQRVSHDALAHPDRRDVKRVRRVPPEPLEEQRRLRPLPGAQARREDRRVERARARADHAHDLELVQVLRHDSKRARREGALARRAREDHRRFARTRSRIDLAPVAHRRQISVFVLRQVTRLRFPKRDFRRAERPFFFAR
jgi:hypothetical protein